MIDLHSHTTASDGQHSPTDLLRFAARAGVTHLAVTDHDTVAGLREAREAASTHGITLIPGIELSAFVQEREVHILGHFIRPDEPELTDFQERLRTARADRMRQMVLQLQRLGYFITFEEVEKVAAGGHLGRPHLARALVHRGIVGSTREAFDRLLGAGKPAFADRFRLPAAEAIALVRRNGGVATVAHPGSSRLERTEITHMKDVGLGGIEALHSDHGPSTREKFLELARELDLVPTYGSDFHGDAVAPGRKLGVATMDPVLLERLQARAGATT